MNNKNLKVLLINPNWKLKNNFNIWSRVASKYPSLGLAYIAAVLRKENFDVKILDMYAENMSIDEFREKYCEKVKNYDFVGLTSTTPLINSALTISKIIKKFSPKTKTILGGVHPTVFPEEVLKNPAVDFVVRGEGEFTLLDLLKNKPLKKITGLSYKKDKKIFHNEERQIIEDLDSLPMPAYDLLPISKYKPPLGGYRKLPAMSIFGTRGCPGRCTFCYRMFEGKIRYKSAKKIFEEVRFLIKNYGIKEINFYDDTFTAIKHNVKEFCELLITNKIKLSWTCFTRVNYVDEEVFGLMKKAGCHLILLGVESGDQKILNSMNKNISIEQIRKAIKICKEKKLKVRASYILGALEDTKETILKTINFALEMDTEYVQFNIMTAYPGTKLWNEAKSKGYLNVKNYDYNCSDFTLKWPFVSHHQLKKFYTYAHKKYYLRFKLFLRQLKDIDSITMLKQKILGVLAILGGSNEL